jgi:HAD superfamily hydrolase (TIGR01509 family)
MNIIIPMGGLGQRFKDCNYKDPKPMIKIFNKQMILYVLDHLDFSDDDCIFIIVRQGSIDRTIITDKYPNINIVQIDGKPTCGAVDTLCAGMSHIKRLEHKEKTLVLDCDTFYTFNIIDYFRKEERENTVIYTKNYSKDSIYSYISLDENNKIINIEEKVKISDNANTGAYYFKDIYEFWNYARMTLTISSSRENYTSYVIGRMIKESHDFHGLEIESKYVFNLGTPKQLEYYRDNSPLLLFDLDGTLIHSDDIYYDIWSEILPDLSREIFDKFIVGNSDQTVVKELFPADTPLSDISEKKDLLFIENIHKLRPVDGSLEFLQNMFERGFPMGLVSNCNRNVIEKIIDHFNIRKYFGAIVVGNECARTKPYPDPYMEAMNMFDTKSDRTIIFEDSKSGLLSASSVFPKCIVGVATNYTLKELKDNGANICIENFVNVDINEILAFQNINFETLKRYIYQSISDIQNVEFDAEKLKGGFICDVLSLRGVKSGVSNNFVLKLEKRDNMLAMMATELDLYNREYYFYNNIAQYVPMEVPRCYGIVKDDNFKNVGILMENLYDRNCTINLDLNEQPISTTLNVIDSMAALHSKFWNKPLENAFKGLKKNKDLCEFVSEKWPAFKIKWSNILTPIQMTRGQYIVDNFKHIQEYLMVDNLTLCHGDIKSPNIFYKKDGMPIFIDWQYICHGKGVQDLVFFIIESFEDNKYINLLREYYYIKLREYGVTEYKYTDYSRDFEYASYYFPFFVAVWFGTVHEDDLIDKNFPPTFIKRLFNFYSYDNL